MAQQVPAFLAGVNALAVSTPLAECDSQVVTADADVLTKLISLVQMGNALAMTVIMFLRNGEDLAFITVAVLMVAAA